MVTAPLHTSTTRPPARERTLSATSRCYPRALRVLLSAGLIVLAGCSDDPALTDPSSIDPAVEPAAGRAPLNQPVQRGHEVPFHELSREVNGFGGYFFDQEGNLVAYLVDPAEEGRARALLESVLKDRVPSRRERTTGEILIRKADYSFVELSAWRDRATHPVLDVEGVVWTDLDEMQNRFVVGISDPAARRAVTRVIRQHDVPLEAVLFQESGRPQESLTLRNHYRPIKGGFQIQRKDGGTCTLGFNAYWKEWRTFLTNSHCTSKVWDRAYTQIFQNNATYDEYVGFELEDPDPWPCGFLSIFRCRWSDAAVIYSSSKVAWDYADVARTNSWGYGWGNAGSITVNPSQPEMTIIGEYSFPTGGEMFDKMGRTTGWTYGYVTKTCVDLNKPSYTGGLGRILCQDWATYYNAPGDSGSPVFRWYGSTVRLAGLNWGYISSGNATYSLFSAMWNIEHDLGSLATY